MTTSANLDFAPYGIDSLWLDRAPRPRTMLLAYPHPDDESFGNGGTIARYTSQGIAVHYACATRGECGTVDAPMLAGYADIAELRTAEQTCAAEALNLAAVHFLGYRDLGMQGTPDNLHSNAFVQAPLDRVAGQLVALIRALRPQVVVTFNPYGGYGHPDHILFTTPRARPSRPPATRCATPSRSRPGWRPGSRASCTTRPLKRA